MSGVTLPPLSAGRLKYIRRLKHKKYRLAEQAFILEGWRLVQAALEASYPLKEVVVTSEFVAGPHFPALPQNSLYLASEQQFRELSDTVTPSGILAVCPLPEAGTTRFEDRGPVLYLDQVRDPGNGGTLLRTAAWLGINSVAFSPGSLDPFQPKVVRGGMGAHFHLRLMQNVQVEDFSDMTYFVIGADHRGQPIETLSLPNHRPWILALGNEAHGLSETVRKRADVLVSIPRRGFGESLNVAISGALLMYELINRTNQPK